MALVTCNECGKDYSDTANMCIHCGYPTKNNKIELDDSDIERIINNEFTEQKKKKPVEKNIIIATVIIVLIVIIAIVGLGSGIGEENDPTYGVKAQDNLPQNEEQESTVHIYNVDFVNMPSSLKAETINDIFARLYPDLEAHGTLPHFIHSTDLDFVDYNKFDSYFWADELCNSSALIVTEYGTPNLALTFKMDITNDEEYALYEAYLSAFTALIFCTSYDSTYLSDNSEILQGELDAFKNQNNFKQETDNFFSNKYRREDITGEIYQYFEGNNIMTIINMKLGDAVFTKE